MTAKENALEYLHTLQQSLMDWERYKKSYQLRDLMFTGD